MHLIAQKMINEYDASKHIYFALPFIRAMATEFEMDTALLWVARLLSHAVDPSEPEAASLEIASSAIASRLSSDLRRLDHLAWKHWCCGDCPTFKMQKAICRFIWAAMGFISHRNNIEFESEFKSELPRLLLTGASDKQIKFSSNQATSALDLAYDLDRSTDDALRLKIAKDFSCEMDRLGRV